jgi:hypothetical protein
MGLESQDATPAELATAFQKIGKLIVAASQLDVSISKLIAATVELGKNPAADMLIHSIDLSRKRQIIESYCSMFAGAKIDFIERLEKFSADLKPAIDDRNTAAHGLLKRHNGKLCISGYASVRHFRNTGKDLRDEKPTHLAIDSLDSKISRCLRLDTEAEELTSLFIAAHAKS